MLNNNQYYHSPPIMMKWLLILVVIITLLSSQHLYVHSTTSGSSLRDWLTSLQSEASTLQIKSNQLEKAINLLVNANFSNVQMRISQREKIKKALEFLNVEIQIINQECSIKGGIDCNITCLNGLNGIDCATTSNQVNQLGMSTIELVSVPPSCDSKCLNCSNGQCLSCSGNWNIPSCSTCKIGWTGVNCTTIDVRGDLVTSSILNSTMASRFVSDIVLGVRNNPIKLLFRYSRDGLPCSSGKVGSETLINGKGPTVLIIKATTGAIFGGYTSLSWSSIGTYAIDSAAFIFSIQSNIGEHRFKKLALVRTDGSIYQSSPIALVFGGGNDIFCGCNNQGKLTGWTNAYSYTNMGQYYLTGSGVPYLSSSGTVVAGTSSFNITDFELFSL